MLIVFKRFDPSSVAYAQSHYYCFERSYIVDGIMFHKRYS